MTDAVPTVVTPKGLAVITAILTGIENSLPKLKAMLEAAEANSLIWMLPGMAELKPFAAEADEIINFLIPLQTQIQSAITAFETTSAAATLEKV